MADKPQNEHRHGEPPSVAIIKDGAAVVADTGSALCLFAVVRS